MIAVSGSTWPSLEVWHVSVAAMVVAVGGACVIAVAARERSVREVRPWIVATILLVALLCSDVQATAMTNYRSHMIEHLAVVTIIAPLFARGSRLRVSRSAATLGLIAFTLLVPLYHLTRVGAWVMVQSGGHYLELGSFLVVGIWFWLPIYGRRPSLSDTQGLVVTFIALPVITTTGLVLWSSDARSVANMSMAMPSMSVASLHAGGMVMIEWGSSLMIAHLVLQAAVAISRRRALHQPVGVRYADRVFSGR